MKKVLLILIAIIGFGFSIHSQVPNSSNKTDQIIGVWKLPLNDPSLEIKCIITKGYWLTIYVRDNIITSSIGGTYTFDGETYKNIILFGTQGTDGNRRGTWKVRFEGNKMHLNGTISTSNQNYYEIWERVE